MWQKLKFVAFLCCVLPWVVVAIRHLAPEPKMKPASEMTRAELRARAEKPNTVLVLAPLVLSAAASVLLLVDALQREYDEPKALPVAIAIVGVMSFGLLSLLYYTLWGRMPTRNQAAVLSDFCEVCCSATLDKPAPGTGSVNLMGTRMLGRSCRCPTCGSVVKTLWVTLILPVVPLGSYRLLPVGTATFTSAGYIGRRTQSMYWPQVWPYLLIVIGAIAIFVFGR